MGNNMLTYHGQTKEMCEWVINTYKYDPLSLNNLTVCLWIEACEQRLKELSEAQTD